MKRFIVVPVCEAKKLGYPFEDYGFYDDYHHHILFETDGEKPIREVASDKMEPEDRFFTRDLSWVVRELNNLAEEKSKTDEGGVF